MKLKVVEVMPRQSHEPTPVEHVLVKVCRLQYCQQQVVSLFLRNDMHHLVKHPNYLCGRSAVVKIEKHVYALEEEHKVEVRRNQSRILMNVKKPRRN